MDNKTITINLSKFKMKYITNLYSLYEIIVPKASTRKLDYNNNWWFWNLKTSRKYLKLIENNFKRVERNKKFYNKTKINKLWSMHVLNLNPSCDNSLPNDIIEIRDNRKPIFETDYLQPLEIYNFSKNDIDSTKPFFAAMSNYHNQIRLFIDKNPNYTFEICNFTSIEGIDKIIKANTSYKVIANGAKMWKNEDGSFKIKVLKDKYEK